MPLPVDSPLPRSPSMRSMEGLLSTLYMNSSGSFGIWKRTSSCACIGDGDVAILQTPPPSTQQPTTSNTPPRRKIHTHGRAFVCLWVHRRTNRRPSGTTNGRCAPYHPREPRSAQVTYNMYATTTTASVHYMN